MKKVKKPYIYNTDCYSSKVKNTFDNYSDEGLIKLQYAINKQAINDLRKKYQNEAVNSLCNYLNKHIIEDETAMKLIITKALEERQMKNLKQLSNIITNLERIITDMKYSLDEMIKIMAEDEPTTNTTTTATAELSKENKADAIEREMKRKMEEATPEDNEITEPETPDTNESEEK